MDLQQCCSLVRCICLILYKSVPIFCFRHKKQLNRRVIAVLSHNVQLLSTFLTSKIQSIDIVFLEEDFNITQLFIFKFNIYI